MSKILWGLILLSLFSSGPLSHSLIGQTKCVRIYYDQSQDPKYKIGKVYATYLQNLLGHFPDYQQIVSPIEYYKKGDLETCKASFYIGSYFQNQIPQAFLDDYKTTQKNVAWLGYNIWQIENDSLALILGHRYSHITKLDIDKSDANGHPGFYRFFEYKGEVFEKFGRFVGADKVFRAGFEMIALTPEEPAKESVRRLSTAVHSVTKSRLPYILQNKNYFYVADVPFSYVHEADRYLIFSDLLFDILNEQPRHPQKLALVRIEDVSPFTPVSSLYKIAKVFAEEAVPLNISLIPVFFDPLYRYDRRPNQEFMPMDRSPEFMRFIEHAKEQGAQFIWHGVTHQYGRTKNPHTGASGEDFEFWDAVGNKPLAEDSSTYVLERLDYGWRILQNSGIDPVAWLTPHYQASALDYQIFARVFSWNIGRTIYFENQTTGIDKDSPLPRGLTYESRYSNAELRKNYFANLKVSTEGNWNGQLYPYEIYGDVYGQRLIPELLGNPQPFESAHVIYPRSIEEILADAKRNLVLRDSWASMFFHPYLLTNWKGDGLADYPGDTGPLRKVLQSLKALGYTFVNLKDFTQNNMQTRPEPIYIQQGIP